MKLVVIFISLCVVLVVVRGEECSSLKDEVKELQERLKSVEELLQRQSNQKLEKSATNDDEKRFIVNGEMDLDQIVAALTQEITTLKQGIASTYVRWGRNTCAGNASLVYRGYMAGNSYKDNGGPANYLCLPDDPTWAKYEDGLNTFGASGITEGNTIYGTEYELYGTFNPFPTDVHDEDAPCAVCRTNHVTTLMIPARTNCYAGWNIEYTGYLMTIHTIHPAATEYICVDSDPEVIPHGSANMNGNVLYFVESVCGSLPCLPYVQGRELACVVCSK